MRKHGSTPLVIVAGEGHGRRDGRMTDGGETMADMTVADLVRDSDSKADKQQAQEHGEAMGEEAGDFHLAVGVRSVETKVSKKRW